MNTLLNTNLITFAKGSYLPSRSCDMESLEKLVRLYTPADCDTYVDGVIVNITNPSINITIGEISYSFVRTTKPWRYYMGDTKEGVAVSRYVYLLCTEIMAHCD